MILHKKIQLFKPIYDVDACLDEIEECLERGWTGLGYKTLEFEDDFKNYTQVPYAHFLNSATSGLHLALEIILKRSTKSRPFVITTPMTFVATNHIIHHAGLEPWFLDIDLSLNMDPNQLEAKLKKDADTVAAVIFVLMGGNPRNLVEVIEISHKYGVSVIVDASHAMGTYRRSSGSLRHIGSEGQRFTVFSFQSVKNLCTADSGMLVSKFMDEDHLARKLSWLGIDKDTYNRQTSGGNWDYNVIDHGWKYHGNSIMAAIAKVQLGMLKTSNEIRRAQAEEYDEKLSEWYVKTLYSLDYIPSRHLYQVRVPADDRDKIIAFAREKGIELGVHYKANTEYDIYVSQRQFVPKATELWKQLISLPIGPHLTHDDLEYIIEVMNNYAH